MTNELFHSNVPIADGNQAYLERPRLDLLLEKAVKYPAVIINAGAGYGKTRAVYSFVRAFNVRTAWIQLSGRDNFGDHFWENFTLAISSINREIAFRLAGMDFPATERQFERYIRIPMAQVVPTDKYIVVYDDLHLVNDKTVLRFMEHCITSPFPNITSIIISRTEPPLNLMGMESKGLLARITEEQFRFTQEEMVSYFRLIGVNPLPQTAAAVYRDTEGWAFAIHLAGLSLKKGGPARAGETSYVPSAIRPNIFKLIESEVMAPLSEALRRFLIKLSLVEQLSPDLLTEIARGPDEGPGPGGEQAPELIARMEAMGSYIHFDTYLNVYSIHHLFLDYLTGRQGDLSEREKQDVWKKASAWCEANNQKMDAVAYCEKAGDYNSITRILYALPLILPTRIARFVLDLLDRSPPDIYRQYPANILLRSRLLISLSRFEQIREELLQVLPSLKELPESSEKHRILMGCNINLGFIGFIDSLYTKHYDFTGFFKEAAGESALMGGYTSRPSANGTTMSAYACRVADGQPENMEKMFAVLQEIVPYAVTAMTGCLSGMYELARGEYAFFRGDAARAEIYLQEGFRRAREYDQYEIENRALFYLLRIYVSRADMKKTGDVLRLLEEELDQSSFLTRYTYYDIDIGWYYIQTGRPGQAASWLKNDYEESGLNNRVQGLEKLVRAKFFLGEKRWPASLAALENREDVEPLLFGKIELKALEAVCRYQARDKEGAFGALAEAYTLAVPAGAFFPFAELGRDMRTLTAAALKQHHPAIPARDMERLNREASQYAKKLGFLLGQEGRKAPGEGTALSRRETEVLKRLSEGLTRGEIAKISSISVNTVKSVIRSVYNKLGAINRADAVRIATEKNIL
ncbi:MAG: LuxR C-terminal-related transcriptional regulator [Spirochaetaceae bacterium]|jgi:LuxR family maltose regulon positive regulatory protein|nr:LuxR C-terminal-related transcriptional regulator [Spirochaetaceae bacterium]